MTDKKVEIIKLKDKIHTDIYNDGILIAQLIFDKNNIKDLKTIEIHKHNWKTAGYRILVI